MERVKERIEKLEEEVREEASKASVAYREGYEDHKFGRPKREGGGI